MKVKMIDPPKGWLYGFPKEIPNDVDNVIEWLTRNGYPEKLVKDLGDNFWARMWYEEVE